MGPSSGVSVRVRDDGWMELVLPGTGDHLVYDEAGTATWIALCHADWNLGDAAVYLADLWESDPWSMRDMMLEWVAEFAAAGVVELCRSSRRTRSGHGANPFGTAPPYRTVPNRSAATRYHGTRAPH